MKRSHRDALAGVFAMVAGIALAASSAPAVEPVASPWSKDQRSAVRIVAGGSDANGGIYRAGLDVELASGFKTYWRSPGDSGVPPVFDWSRSDNVADVTVHWPAPVRFADGGGFSVGYVGNVLLPLAVAPRDSNRPVRLALDLRYAVCKDICIPARATIDLALPRAGSAMTDAMIAAATARVPVPAMPNGPTNGIVVGSVMARESDGSAELAIALATLPGSVTDVFVEGPEPWLFGQPRFEPDATGGTLARIPVDERPKDKPVSMVPLVVTVTSRTGAIVADRGLDVSGLSR